MRFGPEYFKAADLIDQAYEGKIDSIAQLDRDGVQAFVTADRVLVIPGTNELSDWWKFNFKVVRGATRSWHAGFLKHAQAVYKFAKGLDVRRITGHSLGAASAQIVGYSLKINTIAFASPKTLAAEWWVSDSNRFLIENICRVDDLVCAVPPNFQHVGTVQWLTPKRHHWGEDHSISNYVDAMREANDRA